MNNKFSILVREMRNVVLVLLISLNGLFAQSGLLFSPKPAYFGHIPLSSKAERDISLFNVSSSNIQISQINITGTNPSNFKILNDPGTKTIGLLESYILKVEYTPSEESEDVALLNVTVDGNPQSDSLIANGTDVGLNTIAFERILGSDENDGLGNITQTADGGYILAGNTLPADGNFTDFYLIKTDKYGEPQWTNSFGGNNNDFANGIVQANDGGYYIAGTTSSYGNGETSIYFAKLDNSGNEVWHKIFTGQFEDWVTDMVKTSDGNFLLCGGTNSAAGAGRAAYLLKINPNGDKLWQKTYGNTTSGTANQVIEIHDGYAFVGTNEASSGNFDVYLVKTDFNGGLISENSYGSTLTEVGNGISATDDGGFILCGQTAGFGAQARDAFLVKVSINGAEQWNKEFGFAHNDGFSRVVQLSNGGYIAVGSTVTFLDATNEYTDLYVVTTDNSGNKMTENKYGGGRSDNANTLFKASDGLFVVGGNTASYSNKNDIYFLKVNTNGLITNVNKNTDVNLPISFELEQNYPNPFNPSTTIKYAIADPGFVSLDIYNILGQKVKSLINKFQRSGQYKITTNFNNLSSSIYFYQLNYKSRNGNKISIIKKMVLLK